MRDEVATWGLDLRRGWEVYPTEIAGSDPAELVLEGTRGVLIEFPGFWVEIDDPIAIVAEAAAEVEAAGLVPVLAHPERCRAVADDPRVVAPFAERGWLLCLNAPSLVGRHGATAERTAWTLLEAGLVSLAASDAHSRLPAADARRRVPGGPRPARGRRRAAAVRRQRASLDLSSGARRRAASRPAATPRALEQGVRPREVAAAEEAVAAEYGDGCAAVSTWWRVVSTIAPFCCA